jgi:hypothetical protein
MPNLLTEQVVSKQDRAHFERIAAAEASAARLREELRKPAMQRLLQGLLLGGPKIGPTSKTSLPPLPSNVAPWTGHTSKDGVRNGTSLNARCVREPCKAERESH